MKKLTESSFIYNEDIKVWTKEEVSPFLYSDGDEEETYLIELLDKTQDHSVLSEELKSYIKDWPSLYHLSSRRSNLLQPFKAWLKGKRVLEIGCGCGAITRFLGEAGASVVSIEGSIRRARIARKRCSGLENITIICSPSDEMPDLGQFDAVLLIGVLEYATMFLGKQGDEKLLRDCRSRLKDNGQLFIAIENKIGAKYLAGANEDHLAVPMVGINDAYLDNSVCTFARKELLAKLQQTGFLYQEEFIPLPEYKLPVTLVSPQGVKNYSSELSSLAVESVSVDAQGLSDYNFSLEQFINTIWRNGLAADLSNSFLIIAGTSPQHSLYDNNILAWHYSDSRFQVYNKETLFVKGGQREINIVRKNIQSSGDVYPGQDVFLHGNSLWRELVKIINVRDWTIANVSELFKEWLLFITKTDDGTIPHYEMQISNNYFDALPFNIIKEDKGDCIIFDQEWDDGKSSDLGYIAWRGVFHSLLRIKSFEQTSFVNSKTVFMLSSEILTFIWPELEPAIFKNWVEREAVFSAKISSSNFESLLEVAYAAEISYRTNITAQKREKDVLINELYATKVHADNLNTQIDCLNDIIHCKDWEINCKDREIFSLNETIVRQQNSVSWKVTKPLRAVKNTFFPFYLRIKTRSFQLKTLTIQIGKLASDKKNQLGGFKPLYSWFYHALCTYGLKGIVSKTKRRINSDISDRTARSTSYQQWIETSEHLDFIQLKHLTDWQTSFALKPRISIVMPCYNAPVQYLREAIDSVLNQIYTDWELCIADDASTDEDIVQLLNDYAERDKRIKVYFRKENGHISKASNSAIKLATGDYIALMDQDDLLSPYALYCVAAAINENPEIKLIYSDEDKITVDGIRCDPYFKPDWNHDLFLAQNMFSHLGVYKKEIIDLVDGFRIGLEGSQDYDLVLRCLDYVKPDQILHIPHILYHWRIIPGSTASGGEQKPYAFLAGLRAVEDYLKRNDIPARVEEAKPGMLMLRVKYDLPENPPLVTIIIPTRNAKDLVKQCIDSIIEKTIYPHYEIILVDNGSDDQNALDYFADLNGENNIRIMRDDGDFNFSRLNNIAVRAAQGEVLCLMNNDIEIISPDWLDEMVSQAMRPEIGAVGAKLLYPNDTVQHAGVILGLGGIAGHAHIGIHRNDPGYFGRALLVQNFTAVTAACLVVRKEIYEQVGGLNEQDFAVAFNDIDFCIRVYKAGYANLWTPFAELYHHESATRGSDLSPDKIERFKQEIRSMEFLYGDMLLNDPAYNVNLSLDLTIGSFALRNR